VLIGGEAERPRRDLRVYSKPEIIEDVIEPSDVDPVVVVHRLEIDNFFKIIENR